MVYADVQSQGNSTTWPTCLACAVLQRGKERANVSVGEQCQKCFNQYCWDGTINTTANLYNPVLKLNNGTYQEEGQAGNTTSYGVKSTNVPTLYGIATILGLIWIFQGMYFISPI